MRRTALTAALLLALTACGGESAETTAATTSPAGAVETGACANLFGAPGEMTGLDAESCRPERVCEGTEPFIPPTYDEASFEALRARVLMDPPALLPISPYADPGLVPDPAGVCGVVGGGGAEYSLATFADTAAAEQAGAAVTHTGACGACSSLQDLAVYLSVPDLGGPVRECALIELGGNPEATLECIQDLGFTEPCAQIWMFNSMQTRESCLVECLDALDEPSHLPDGTLNACLQCDEDNSGPVFKAVAGRTRRNSGIPSAICRPGEDVAAILHDAYP